MAIGTPVAGALAENASAASSLAVPYPATIAAGDLLLMVVIVSVSTAPNNASGWTSIVSGGSGTGSQSPAIRWSYKIADGTESGNQTVTMSSSTSRGRMWAISGVDQTTPIDATGTHTPRAIDGATTHPGVTTTVVDTQVWASGIKNSGSLTWDAITSPFTMTEVIDDTSPYPTSQVSYRLAWTGSGATGDVTFDSANAVRAAYDVFALRPASSATDHAASGEVAASTTATGDVTATLGASGAAPASSAASGAVTARLVATATLAAVAAITGSVTAQRPAIADVAAVSSATGDVTAVLPTTGSVAASSGAAGTVTAQRPAVATVGATSAVAGNATVTSGAADYAAAGTFAATSAVAGDVVAALGVVGAVDSASGATGSVVATLTATGTVDATSTVAGAAVVTPDERDITPILGTPTLHPLALTTPTLAAVTVGEPTAHQLTIGQGAMP